VFTGIVEELGEVVSKEELGDSARLVIRAPVVTADGWGAGGCATIDEARDEALHEPPDGSDRRSGRRS